MGQEWLCFAPPSVAPYLLTHCSVKVCLLTYTNQADWAASAGVLDSPGRPDSDPTLSGEMSL